MERIWETKDVHKIEAIEDNPELVSLVRANTRHILCIPESVGRQSRHKVIMPQTYNFAKWVRKNKTDIAIDVAESEGIKSLHSHDFWIPVVILASDMSVQVFLNLVSSFIYDRIKGALKHDKTDVHVQVYYEETPHGTIKRFSYDGSVEGFEKVARRFKINKFLD